MMYKYIIKFNKKEDILSLKAKASIHHEINQRVYLNHFCYDTNEDNPIGDNFLFYQSLDISLDSFLSKLELDKISEDDITKIDEFPENILIKVDTKCPDFIYIANYPKEFTIENMVELLSCLPDNASSSYKPRIEKLPCVFKVFFLNSKDYQYWIESILSFIPHIHFATENITMTSEMNCIEVPVIHFIDLPSYFTTIECFIEKMKDDLGDFKSYEENSQDRKKLLSVNISYQTNDEAWEIIDQMNFQQYEGKEIRVNHFIDVKFLKEMSRFNIKVTNYEGEFNSFDIYENFQQFGSIYSIYNSNPLIDEENDVNNEIQQTDLSNSNKDFFCVQYYLKECAINAINNACEVLNMKNMTMTTKDAGIVIYNFERDVTIEKVKEVFPSATKIVIKNSTDKNSRPYVFVNFICQEDCDEASDMCSKIYRDHLRLMCVPQTLSKKNAFEERKKYEVNCQQKFTVFIQNVPPNIYVEEIIQKCSLFGDIDSAVLIEIKTKSKKRIAKISFNSDDAYQKAVNSTIVLNKSKIKLKQYIPQK